MRQEKKRKIADGSVLTKRRDPVQEGTGSAVFLGDCKMDRWVTMKNLCDAFGVSSQTIRRWIRQGKLPQPDIPGSIHEAGIKRWRPGTIELHVDQVAVEKQKGLKVGAA